ncbi:MAG: peptidase [Xanthomonadales bacterium]|nr:peptidase [Xanthomonadales bacterium]
MPSVNPQLLVWARETAGYDVAEAAKRLGLVDGKKATAAEKLAALERGESPPSRSQLLKMSKQYRRPLLIFYLDEPPARADRGEDFRTLRHAVDPSLNGVVDALVRNIKARQQIMREALLSEHEHRPLTFIGSYAVDQGVPGLVDRIKEATQVDLNVYRSKKNQEDAFKYLREQIEGLGIFSILAGNLGSHHTNLTTEVFRGFAIADSIAPFVVINDQDAKTAWPMTLFHEVAHLWLGATGISGSSAERRLEQFCDKVASEFLLPESELRDEFPYDTLGDLDSSIDSISYFANERNVSSSLVAYRLLDRSAITEASFDELSKHFYERWKATLERQKQKARVTRGGPSYYVLKRLRNGSALIAASERLMRAGELSTTQAAQVLGVRPLRVGNLFSQPRLA